MKKLIFPIFALLGCFPICAQNNIDTIGIKKVLVEHYNRLGINEINCSVTVDSVFRNENGLYIHCEVEYSLYENGIKVERHWKNWYFDCIGNKYKYYSDYQNLRMKYPNFFTNVGSMWMSVEDLEDTPHNMTAKKIMLIIKEIK